MAGHFISAEWRLCRQHVVRIHPDSSSTESLHQIVHLIDVLGEDRSSQTVVVVVGTLNYFVQRLEPNQLLYGTKNLEESLDVIGLKFVFA